MTPEEQTFRLVMVNAKRVYLNYRVGDEHHHAIQVVGDQRPELVEALVGAGNFKFFMRDGDILVGDLFDVVVVPTT